MAYLFFIISGPLSILGIRDNSPLPRAFSSSDHKERRNAVPLIYSKTILGHVNINRYTELKQLFSNKRNSIVGFDYDNFHDPAIRCFRFVILPNLPQAVLSPGIPILGPEGVDLSQGLPWGGGC